MDEQNQTPPVQPQVKKHKFWKKVLIVYLGLVVLLMILAWPAYHFEWEIYNRFSIQILMTLVLLVVLWTIIFHGPEKKIWRIPYAVCCIIVIFGLFYFLGSDLFREWTLTETVCQVDSECVPIYGPDSCVSPQEYQRLKNEAESSGAFMLGVTPGNVCRCDVQKSKCEYSSECGNFIPCM
jgi:hypothetical protein